MDELIANLVGGIFSDIAEVARKLKQKPGARERVIIATELRVKANKVAEMIAKSYADTVLAAAMELNK